MFAPPEVFSSAFLAFSSLSSFRTGVFTLLSCTALPQASPCSSPASPISSLPAPTSSPLPRGHKLRYPALNCWLEERKTGKKHWYPCFQKTSFTGNKCKEAVGQCKGQCKKTIPAPPHNSPDSESGLLWGLCAAFLYSSMLGFPHTLMINGSQYAAII